MQLLLAIRCYIFASNATSSTSKDSVAIFVLKSTKMITKALLMGKSGFFVIIEAAANG